MKKVKLNNDVVNPKDLLGMPWPSTHSLSGQVSKRSKMAAVEIKDGVIVDYRKCQDSSLRIYTVEMVTEETFRCFQVGTYDDPIVFRMSGYASTKYRSQAYFNWENYRMVLVDV